MEARKNIAIGIAALAFAVSMAPAVQAAPVATQLHARHLPSSVQNRRAVNTPRYAAPRRYYHSNRPNYYSNGNTVVIDTPYGWETLDYPTYYYPNGQPYYGPYSGWNSPPTAAPISPGPPLNLSPLGPVPTQPLLGPIPKGGVMGSAPTGSILHR